jgi:HD-like signal output (HDOD) protein
MNSEELNIVFVDDEQRILDGLRRQLRANRRSWDMRFATSGAEALQMLETRPADIIVTDMRMPGMNGGELLRLVLQKYPQMTRIVLSGQTDQTELLRDLACIHQYLQKPCEPPQICHAIERTFALAKQFQKPRLKLAANRITTLPPGSESYQALVAELAKVEADVVEVARIVARDPALTVKLIQLVNSAFFGMPRKISRPHDAVVLLGLSTLRAIVVAGRIFEFVAHSSANSAQLSKLWIDSFEIGESAAGLAKANGASDAVQRDARLVGLLSLIGRGILLTSEPEAYASVIESARANERTLSQSEAEIFGVCQDVVTAYAMGLWAFPDDLVAAIAYQSTPSQMPDATPHHPVGYLHLARYLRQATTEGVGDQIALDSEFVASHNLASLVESHQRSAA